MQILEINGIGDLEILTKVGVNLSLSPHTTGP